MSRFAGMIAVGLAALCCGCAQWKDAPAKGNLDFLKQASPSHDSVTLEIFTARVPYGDRMANGPLWDTVDEQHLPASVRRHMAHNGMRAGLVGSQASPELTTLLKLTDAPVKADQGLDGVLIHETEPTVRRRVLQLRYGQRRELAVSSTHQNLAALLRDDEQLSGTWLEKAQGLFAIQTSGNRDGSVHVTLTPELHHGEPRQQWTGQEGMFRLEMARPRQTYERLRTEFDLNIGQMVVLGCFPDRPGSLGEHFFCDKSASPPEQKVVVVRLIQTVPGDPYTMPEPIDLTQH